MKSLGRRLVHDIAPPVGLFLLVALLWQWATAVYDLPAYLLPSPVAVAEAAYDNFATLLSATALTAAAALCGFLASLIAGSLIAFAFSQSRLVRSGCFPYAIFLQTVPIVAVAPLIIIWFDYGFQSVVVVSFIISLFPIITNATAGLMSVDADLIDLFRLHNATRWQILWKLRLPSAVPHVVTGAKTSSGLAVIGAIVGEFFAGYGAERFGLGYLVRQTSDQLKTDQLFAAIIASALLGIVIFGTVSLAGATILVRWSEQPTGSTS